MKTTNATALRARTVLKGGWYLKVYYEEESAECSEEAAKNAIALTKVWAYSKGTEMLTADPLSEAYPLSPMTMKKSSKTFGMSMI